MNRIKRKVSDETRKKMSEAQTGKIVSEETKVKHKRKMSEVTKEKIRQAKKGKKASEETKAKLRDARKNRIITDATKQKISNSLIKYWKSVIWINEISENENKEFNDNLKDA